MLRVFLDQHPDDLPAPPPLAGEERVRATIRCRRQPVANAKPRVVQMVLSVFGALVPISAGVSLLRDRRGAARMRRDTWPT